jgi:signal transduction histidine kinase
MYDSDFACVTVSDDGRGMDNESKARIFEPFFTTRQNEGGTGLGLSVAHGIVTDHSGTIRVESKAGTGTSVVVCLPRHA